jgi:NitT/TauT family transport system substrate-binding protein
MVVMCLAGLVALGLIPAASGQARRRVTILMPHRAPNPDTPAPYVAQALGFFAEEGLDAAIVQAGGTVDAFKFLVLNRGDFAHGTPDALVRAVQNGDPIKSVCTYTFRNILDVAVLASSPIRTVKDFKGKKVGVSGAGSSAIQFMDALLNEVGLKPSDVQYVFVGEQASAFTALNTRQVDALAISDSNTALFDVEGVALRRIESPLSKKLMGPVIAARNDTITQEPRFVESYLRAFAKAQHYYLSNPKAGILGMGRVVPDIGRDVDRSLKLGAPRRAKSELPREAGGLYCWSSAERWELMQEFLVATNYVKQKADVTTYVATQFLVEANRFDRTKIRQDALAVK